jgi:hypothetical protein
MVPDLMLPCAIGRRWLSGTGRWTVMGAVVIGLFRFGEYAFGPEIGWFTFDAGGLSCCWDSLGTSPAAGLRTTVRASQREQRNEQYNPK